MNIERIGDWMQTASGRAFYPLDPRVEEIDIADIAHALSNLCRFGGHCNRFYSVAEHSLLVASVLPPELQMQGLLHDATEAYMVDVPRPLKRQLPEYGRMEDRLWSVVAERFGLPETLDPLVKEADNNVLLAEKEQLLGPSPAPWSVPGVAAKVHVHGLSPDVAAALFVRAFVTLGGKA